MSVAWSIASLDEDSVSLLIRLRLKFAAFHASVHNHFNQERHLHNRANFKLNRSAALAEWRQLCAT